MAKDGSIFSSDIKFDGSNYIKWAFSVRTIVRDAGFDDHSTNSPPYAKEDEATMKIWIKSYAKVMGDLTFFRWGYSPAKEIWRYLEE
jgi:hypothetical protein